MQVGNLTIKTNFDLPPIPDRRFDWSAWVDGMEEWKVGRGETEIDAIVDLRNQLIDDGAIAATYYVPYMAPPEKQPATPAPADVIAAAERRLEEYNHDFPGGARSLVAHLREKFPGAPAATPYYATVSPKDGRLLGVCFGHQDESKFPRPLILVPITKQEHAEYCASAKLPNEAMERIRAAMRAESEAKR